MTPNLPVPTNKIITLIHKDTTIPGVVGQKLEAMGYQLDIRAPIFGDALPERLSEYAAALVFGGPMSVNDDEPYLQKELMWIRQVLEAQMPYLGICLGAQLLAKALDAKVDTHVDGVEEIGYYPIYATALGADTFPEKLMAYQWHSQGFELPEGAVLLATGTDFPNQAFRWGDRAYGLQFHPEMTADMVDFWTSQGADLLGAPNAKSRCEQIEDHVRYSPEVGRWLETFLNNWLAIANKQA
ncbi:MAG: gamma-glutamyl-gamma-aminobutyrate hydrolase family protein [Cyanobacteria bacterium J06581_3]